MIQVRITNVFADALMFRFSRRSCAHWTVSLPHLGATAWCAIRRVRLQADSLGSTRLPPSDLGSFVAWCSLVPGAVLNGLPRKCRFKRPWLHGGNSTLRTGR